MKNCTSCGAPVKGSSKVCPFYGHEHEHVQCQELLYYHRMGCDADYQQLLLCQTQ